MEYLKEVDDRGQGGNDAKVAPRQPPSSYRPRSTSPHRPSHARAASTPIGYIPQHNRPPVGERTGLIRSFSTADIEGINETVDYAGTKPAGADSDEARGADPNGAAKSGVSWTLRFGGLMALVGALICRKVAPTKTEKAMRRRLAEMQEETAESEV
ncbi:hypothetical protein QFC19_003020 [Naganishia cerealis]|uniref:Uncharacterized protein n=1 Tax=Naganishia cerealis TaxID=610337 RepID=A0ACC2W5H7_9TREE|nr:hypothetical protein QFC19_003020 [Naganishia cerealis]